MDSLARLLKRGERVLACQQPIVSDNRLREIEDETIRAAFQRGSYVFLTIGTDEKQRAHSQFGLIEKRIASGVNCEDFQALLKLSENASDPHH